MGEIWQERACPLRFLGDAGREDARVAANGSRLTQRAPAFRARQRPARILDDSASPRPAFLNTVYRLQVLELLELIKISGTVSSHASRPTNHEGPQTLNLERLNHRSAPTNEVPLIKALKNVVQRMRARHKEEGGRESFDQRSEEASQGTAAWRRAGHGREAPAPRALLYCDVIHTVPQLAGLCCFARSRSRAPPPLGHTRNEFLPKLALV